MIVAPRFVFLHLHKSGGTFVNELLMRHVPGARQIGYHLPRSLLPAEFTHLPVLGTVRSPWSYYVSWYAFQQARPQPNALFRVLSAENTLGFRGTIARMLRLGEDEALLDAVVAALPAQYTNRGLNLPGFALARIRGTGRGFYSFLYDYLYAGATPAHVARMESLREEMRWLLGLVGEPLAPAFEQELFSMPARNTSHHGPAADYYDQELARDVALRDAPVIEAYGYAFGD